MSVLMTLQKRPMLPERKIKNLEQELEAIEKVLGINNNLSQYCMIINTIIKENTLHLIVPLSALLIKYMYLKQDSAYYSWLIVH